MVKRNAGTNEAVKKRDRKSDFFKNELAKNLLLDNMPKDVSRLIGKEQSRMHIEDKSRLKKRAVVYEIVREWYRQKSIIHDQHERIEALEKKLHEANL